MLYYHKSIATTYEELKTSPDGLSNREAAARLATYGRNEVRITGDPLWKIIIEPFRDVFTLILFIAAVISFLQNAIFDGIIILVIITISAVIYYVQRFSTDNILRSLQRHTAQKVDVVRGGRPIKLDSSELVPGDIVQLGEGDKIPADIRLVVADSVRADEAVLTGESIPVSKNTEKLEEGKQVYEQTNILFQGSFLVAGRATGIVVATANDTEFGRIAALSKKSADAATSPVQKKIDKLLVYIIAVVGGLAVVAFILALIRGVEFGEAILFVLAISVSAVPESLPIAISVILVLGMRRMAAKNALVRNMRAIETIGVITTIGTDKTGTLTENKLSVQATWHNPSSHHHLPTIAYHTINGHGRQTKDPLDTALLTYTHAETLHEQPGETIATLPFDQTYAMSGNIRHYRGHYELFVKGAPERVLERSQLSSAQQQQAAQELERLTSQGYRVIALATATLPAAIVDFDGLPKATKFDFVGYLAIADTLRPSVRRAIRVAQDAGVTVRMITGDHFETAYHIGKQLGLVTTRDQVFDSRQMDELSEHELTQRVYQSRVFSRVTPENKFRILQALKVKEITAMTGDGVNDVPALSNAHVGLAMGSGSQIAKDAGSIILLDDNFASIVQAMKEGRIIFSNIQRMLYYLLSTNSGEAITMITAIAIGLPMPLMPVQILWINLVTDTSLVIPLGLEPGEKDIMKQKPVDPKAPLLNRYMIIQIALMAVFMAGLALAIYAYFTQHFGVAYAQTITFTALAVMQWAGAFNARSTYESVFTRLTVNSKPLYIGLAVSIILQLLAIFGPLQGLLHVVPVQLDHLVIASLAGFLLIIAVGEIYKWIGRRLRRRSLEKSPR